MEGIMQKGSGLLTRNVLFSHSDWIRAAEKKECSVVDKHPWHLRDGEIILQPFAQ
jgi:hypothetical protein